MNHLPEGWASVALHELFDFKYGKGLREDRRIPTGPIQVFGSNGVIGSHDVALTHGPTIIVGRKGSVGEVHLSRNPCWPIDTTYFIDAFPAGIPPEFWYLYLKSLQLGQQDKSSAIPGISRKDIYDIEVLVPPLAEQRRIGERLKELLGKVDTCRKHMEAIRTILKRFRQSVLDAACSGRLTAEWREKNPATEPADILLGKIRELRLASAKSKKEKAQIEEVFDEKNLRIDEGELGLNDIPDTWLSCRVGAIGAVCNGSTPSRKESRFWGGNIPWISSGEVRNNVISESRECITQAGYENSSVRLLPRGTVLLAMIGEGKTRGQSAILSIEATINQNIAAVVLDHGLVRSDYLWRWFQLQYESTRERGSGSGPQALNCQRVRELPFVLPPIDEQNEIIRRVEELFALAEGLDDHYSKAGANMDGLVQSMLAKAFRGELVTTEAALAETEDRDFESAEELLARIRDDDGVEAKPEKRERPINRKLAANS